MSILGATHEAFLPHGLAQAGVGDHDAFIREIFEADYGSQDANNLLCQIERWHDADVADGGDLQAALDRVTCRTDVIALAGDRLFPPEEVVEQARMLPDAEVHVVGSAWGHYAMGGFDAAGVTLAAGRGLPSSGYGMLSMAERAELVGGTLEVRSQPGTGTAVCVTVPVDGRNPARRDRIPARGGSEP